MSMNDPLGDMLTRIRNAQMRGKSTVKTPASKLRAWVLDVLAAAPLERPVVVAYVCGTPADPQDLAGQSRRLADAGVLDKYNVRLLGTPLQTIRNAEDRELFKQLLINIGEPVPPSATVTTLEEAHRVAEELEKLGTNNVTVRAGSATIFPSDCSRFRNAYADCILPPI